MSYRIKFTVEQRNEFRKRMLRFRSGFGLTQEQLAQAMGVHVNTIHRIEREWFVPSMDTVLRFAEVEQRYREGWYIEKKLKEVPRGADDRVATRRG